MQAYFFDETASSDAHALCVIDIPLVPRIGEHVLLPGDDPRTQWLVCNVVWDYKHTPPDVALYVERVT